MDGALGYFRVAESFWSGGPEVRGITEFCVWFG